MPLAGNIVRANNLLKYNISSFHNVDSIGVLCRGSSLSFLSNIKDKFDHCFLVGQFENASKQIGSSIVGKNIVQIINKCAIKLNKNFAYKYNIIDIQCNFGSYFGEKLSPEKLKLYKKIVSSNPGINVHLVNPDIIKHRPRALRSWPTCGIFGVDLAAFLKPKQIYVIGLDFYCSEYFCEEKIQTTAKSNRKRASEMLFAFNEIVSNNPDVIFFLYTKLKNKLSNKNLVCHVV